MDNAKLACDHLAHIDDRYYFGAHCRKCGHYARLNLTKLRNFLGPNYPLARIRQRLRCQRCGDRRQIVVKFIAPNERDDNLTHFFGRRPRS